jgi:hypothetical protein
MLLEDVNCGREELRLGEVTHQEVLERILDVAVEHLEGDDDVALVAREPFQQRQLDPMRVHVIVLLTEKDDIGPRHGVEQRIEIADARRRGVYHAVRDVSALCGQDD